MEGDENKSKIFGKFTPPSPVVIDGWLYFLCGWNGVRCLHDGRGGEIHRAGAFVLDEDYFRIAYGWLSRGKNVSVHVIRSTHRAKEIGNSIFQEAMMGLYQCPFCGTYCGCSGTATRAYATNSDRFPIYRFEFAVPSVESRDPVRLYGQWVTPKEFEQAVERIREITWDAIALIKYHAKNLCLAFRPFEIRQPCWSSNRWKSKT